MLMGFVFSAEENDLTILSWNIKMLNGPYGWLHNRTERSENIVHTLNTAENTIPNINKPIKGDLLFPSK